MQPLAAALVEGARVLASAGAAAAAPPPRSVVIVEGDSDGFHWLDACVGAATVVAVFALAYGLLLLRRAATGAASDAPPNA